jgi:hypothetical protein
MEERTSSCGRHGLHGAVVWTGQNTRTRTFRCTEHMLFLFLFVLVVKLINFYALSQNCENRLVASSRLFASLFSRKNSASSRRIFIKFNI